MNKELEEFFTRAAEVVEKVSVHSGQCMNDIQNESKNLVTKESSAALINRARFNNLLTSMIENCKTLGISKSIFNDFSEVYKEKESSIGTI